MIMMRNRSAVNCQLVTEEKITPPVKITRMPERKWQELALDLLGPIPTGEHLLVLVDYFSRWVEVDIIKLNLPLLRRSSSVQINSSLDMGYLVP